MACVATTAATALARQADTDRPAPALRQADSPQHSIILGAVGGANQEEYAEQAVEGDADCIFTETSWREKVRQQDLTADELPVRMRATSRAFFSAALPPEFLLMKLALTRAV